MPTPRRRSRSVADAASEGDLDAADRKRRRLERNVRSIKDESTDDDDDDDDDDDVEEFETPVAQRPPRPSLTSQCEYQPGSIVRVTVHNFVTYEHAEFLPGPNLNMIIGPNGTGKSSLVCAICLGLGYHSNVLGRAASFGEFVKHGKDHATVEIELQKPERQRANDIIMLRISAGDNSRQFRLNGQASSLKAIQELMQKRRIQIDNLCQFLPQDKVAEFAGLSPVELLVKTLQAAAPREMADDQEKLRAMYRQQREAEAQIGAEAERLRSMETRQQALMPDVDRLREREEIEKGIDDLKLAHMMVSYQEARLAHSAAKQRRKAAESKLRKFEARSGPAMEIIKAKEDYANKIKLVIRDRLKPALKQAEVTADRLATDITDLDDKLSSVQNQRQVEHDGLRGKRNDISESKKKIGQLERKMAEQPEPFDAQEWNTKIREQEHKSRELDSQRREIAEKVAEVNQRGRRVSNERGSLKEQLDQLDTKSGQRFKWLEREHPDVAEGVKWLREPENMGLFEKEVFGPPLLSCSVKNESYTDHVQSQLQHDDFLCFITQSRADHTKLSDKFYKDLGLSVTIRSCLTPLDQFKPPMTERELRELGLDGFAVDYLEGPAPVLAMLCAEKKMHAYAIGRGDITEEQQEQLMAHKSLSSFAAGGITYRMSRRPEYGPHAISTSANEIQPGTFWMDQPVDPAEKAQLRQRYQEVVDQLQELSRELKALQAQNTEWSQEIDEIAVQVNELKAAKSEKQRVANQFRALPEKKRIEEERFAERRQHYQEALDAIIALDSEVDAAAAALVQATLRHHAHLPKIQEAYKALIEARIKQAEAESDITGLKSKNSEMHEILTEGRHVVADLTREIDQCREAAQILRDELQTLFQDLDAERRGRVEELWHGKTAQEVENELNAQKARLEFVHAANPRIIEEFEQRARDIEKHKRQKARLEETARTLSADIDQLRQAWEPQLDAVIARIDSAFGYNFEQINCAGEVGVHKDEDFDKWAVEIKVRFREGEELQLLDQHRQSGGERAVSTIFYLMSLQAMAQAPFRVVDEINQGMDPRNERMVHERMVEIACEESGGSQYFLITPKLLTGLRYHARMRILCIASGLNVPKGNKSLNFRDFVITQKRLLAAAAAAAAARS